MSARRVIASNQVITWSIEMTLLADIYVRQLYDRLLVARYSFLGKWWSDPVYTGSDFHFYYEENLKIPYFGASSEERHDCIRLPMV